MLILKAVGVRSFARVMAAIYGALGLLAIPIALISMLANIATGERSVLLVMGVLALAIVAPFFYAGIGFLAGALMAWIYNTMARLAGGIQIELTPATAQVSTTAVGLI